MVKVSLDILQELSFGSHLLFLIYLPNCFVDKLKFL